MKRKRVNPESAKPYDTTARVLRRMGNHTAHCKCPTCCDCGKPRDERAANPYDAVARRLPR